MDRPDADRQIKQIAKCSTTLDRRVANQDQPQNQLGQGFVIGRNMRLHGLGYCWFKAFRQRLLRLDTLMMEELATDLIFSR